MQITDIIPYLPFYLGCEASTGSGKVGKLVSVSESTSIIVYPDDDPRGRVAYTKWIIPHLRPLTSVSEDEWNEIESKIINPDAYGYYGIRDNIMLDVTRYRFGWKIINETLIELRRRGIDVDGLIPAGLAKIKIPQNLTN